MVTGNYIDSAVDLPSVQYGMSWGRFYNSLYDDATMTPDNGSTTGATPRVPLARGWVHSFSSHLRLVPDGAGGYQVPYPGSGNITYVDATGSPNTTSSLSLAAASNTPKNSALTSSPSAAAGNSATTTAKPPATTPSAGSRS